MTRFDPTDSALVDTLYTSFNGKPDALKAAVTSMWDLNITPSP